MMWISQFPLIISCRKTWLTSCMFNLNLIPWSLAAFLHTYQEGAVRWYIREETVGLGNLMQSSLTFPVWQARPIFCCYCTAAPILKRWISCRTLNGYYLGKTCDYSMMGIVSIGLASTLIREQQVSQFDTKTKPNFKRNNLQYDANQHTQSSK